VPTLWIRREDYPDQASWRLLDWCATRGADEFGLSFLGPPYQATGDWAEVDRLLAPFRRRIASAGDRWRLTGESADALRSVLPEGLFTYEPGTRSLEDPTIYRGGTPLLAIVTHEGEGTVAATEADAESLARAGLPFHLAGRQP
jgi:hypothetical protein